MEKITKKVLYITDTASDAKSGAGSNCSLHRIVLNSIVKNMFFIFLQETIDNKIENSDCYIDNQSFFDKFINIFWGYPSYLTKKKRRGIFERIKKFKPETIYFDMSVCGKIQKNIRKKYKECRIITFFHDIEYDLMREQMTQISRLNFLRRVSVFIQIQNEKKAVESANACIVLNKRDLERFKAVYHREPTIVLPALNESHFNKSLEDVVISKEFRILFVGGFYGPNVEGILWFCEKVVPDLGDNCRVEIVGKDMEKLKSCICNSKIDVIGTVDSLDEYYYRADVAVGPIFSGGGMKTKTGEAFSYGKCYVGTIESLFGYIENAPDDFLNKYIYQCETDKEFAEALKCIALSNNKKKSYPQILEWFNKNYSTEAAQDIYLKVL